MLSTTIALAMAAVLTWAGLGKLRDPAPAAATLRRLGAPAAGARGLALLLAGTEVAVALALVARPGAAWTQAGVAALAAAFALAGAAALTRGEAIRCACFGAGGGRLGWRQVAALVPWLGAVAWLRAVPPEAGTPADAAARLAVVGLALAGVLAVAVRRAQAAARGDRLSAEEMLPWLP